MSRILIWGLTENYGGVEKYIIDRLPIFLKKYDEIFIGVSIGSNLQYKSYLDHKNIHINYFPHLSRPSIYFSSIINFIKNQNINTVYCNIGFSNGLLYKAVKSSGAELIVHAHNTRIDVNSIKKRVLLNIYHYISRALFNNIIDRRYACSREAGEWLFADDNFKVKKNAIDLSKFTYNLEDRIAIRKSLGISLDTFVLGHVGRFSYQKNQEFLVDLFKIFQEMYPESKLLFVGDGETKSNIRNQCRLLGIEEKVLFLGFRNDVSKLMQAMDCFILPSRFEGLGIVGIEAQAADLPCFFANTITSEVLITSNSHMFSLNMDLKDLAERIYKYSYNLIRGDNTDTITQSGYSLQEELKECNSSEI